MTPTPNPKSAGWHTEPETGRTRFWDGESWGAYWDDQTEPEQDDDVLDDADGVADRPPNPTADRMMAIIYATVQVVIGVILAGLLQRGLTGEIDFPEVGPLDVVSETLGAVIATVIILAAIGFAVLTIYDEWSSD